MGVGGAASLGSNSPYQPCEAALEPSGQGSLATLVDGGADELRLRNTGHARGLCKPGMKIRVQPDAFHESIVSQYWPVCITQAADVARQHSQGFEVC